MKAFVFPGQGAQYPGMGKEVYNSRADVKELMDFANEVLGFNITDIMFNGSKEDLLRTEITQPAIYIDSVATSKTLQGLRVEAVAGHSLGEFSALTVAGVLSFKDGLELVSERAQAMKVACEENPGAMAAILGMKDHEVEEVCQSITAGIVVPANYNSPGQLVISGDEKAVQQACEMLKEKGAKRALMLPVNGAFHSPLMEPARQRLEKAIDATEFKVPNLKIYQNVTAQAVSDPEEIKENLKKQLTSSVKWTQSVQNMIRDGISQFTEVGPGKALQGMIKKIDPDVLVNSTDA